MEADDAARLNANGANGNGSAATKKQAQEIKK
jgi:hypothetical protein